MGGGALQRDAWLGACMAGGHVWWGALCDGGHPLQGACMAGGAWHTHTHLADATKYGP